MVNFKFLYSTVSTLKPLKIENELYLEELRRRSVFLCVSRLRCECFYRWLGWVAWTHLVSAWRGWWFFQLHRAQELPRGSPSLDQYGPGCPETKKKSILNKPKLLTISDGIQCRHTWSGDSVYLSEGDGDASIQLNVVCQLGELVLLLLKRLQQTVDLLLCQHDSAVVLRQERRIRHQAYRCSLSL